MIFTWSQDDVYKQKVVVEEFTGVWCAWCVRGTVFMDRFQEHWGDDIIPIAVHGPTSTFKGSSNADPMCDDDYVNSLHEITRNNGYPYVIFNRVKSTKGYLSDENFLTIEDLLSNEANASIALNATLDAETREVKTSAEVTFRESHANADYRIAYVVTEDDVNVPDDPHYRQQNGYAGGGSGEMGGYENLPSVIPAEDAFYSHVVRGSYGGFSGIQDALPKTIEANTAYVHNYEFIMKKTVLKPENCNVIAMLINASDEIDNACSVKPLILDPSGIKECQTEGYAEIESICGTDGCIRKSVKAGVNIIRYKNGTTKKILIK